MSPLTLDLRMRQRTHSCVCKMWHWSAALLFLAFAQSSMADKGKLVVLHLTDLHIDLKYSPGREGSCQKPPCCRKDSDPSIPIRTHASMVGEYNCDTRFQVLQSALDAVNMQLKPDVVVWTGDTAPHHDGTTKEEVLESIGYVAQELKKRLPGVPVVPSLGNYDFVPMHSDPGPPLNSWLLHPAADMFSEWLPSEALDTFKYAGYYEHLLGDGLRVVALNTQMCHIKNLFQFVDNTNGQEQLAWLEGVLKRAQLSNEQVLITGHIPPGMYGGCWGRASKDYEVLLGRYSHVIAGQLFGHQHSGSFRLLREGSEYYGKPVAVAHVTPAFATFKGGNPAFRLYDLKKDPQWNIVDFRQFFLPLNQYDFKAKGLQRTANLNWVLGYSPVADFNMTDMTAIGWQALRDKFDADPDLKLRYQQAESSERPWQGPGELGDYLCGTSHVSDVNLQECLGTSEEILVRKYTGATHTYVITAMFPFDSVLDYFCPVLQGIHPSDCPPRLYDGGHIPDLKDVTPDLL